MDAAELAFAGAARQAALIRSREISARELVQTYLERIGRLDPELNACRAVFADQALAEADQADARAEAGETRPLLGVPIAVKDDCDVAGDITAFGSSGEQVNVISDHQIPRGLAMVFGLIGLVGGGVVMMTSLSKRKTLS